jgi:hypothetical protein
VRKQILAVKNHSLAFSNHPQGRDNARQVKVTEAQHLSSAVETVNETYSAASAVVFTFSSILSDKLAALRPATCDGVLPPRSGSTPAHKNACVRPVLMCSCPSPCFFDGRNSGKTVEAINLVAKAPVNAKRLMTNLLSGGKSAIRSCKLRGNSPHLHSGGDENAFKEDASALSCSTGTSMKGSTIDGARIAPSP